MEVRLGLLQGHNSTIPCLAKKGFIEFFWWTCPDSPPWGSGFLAPESWSCYPFFFDAVVLTDSSFRTRIWWSVDFQVNCIALLDRKEGHELRVSPWATCESYTTSQ